jgi:hypothetical protein
VIGISRSARQLDRRKTVALAANLISGSAFPDCLRSLSHQGRLAVVGYVNEKLKAEIDLEAVHGTRS